MWRKVAALFALTSLAAIGLGVAAWLVWFPPWRASPGRGLTGVRKEPARLATISVPHDPASLAWSADGGYLAAGTKEWSFGGNPTEVLILDPGKQAVVATLKVTSSVELMAFSPDGKWLAVSLESPVVQNSSNWGAAELVVFDVPAFNARFKTKSKLPLTRPDGSIAIRRGFVDLAWAADSQTLHAVEADEIAADQGAGPEFHRWDVATFTEQPSIKIDRSRNIDCTALAASPDGVTLAVAGKNPSNHLQIRLFNHDKEAEIAAIEGDEYVDSPRLGFTADGKAVGVINGLALSWWDVATGRQANPISARFAVQPPGRCWTSPDCSKWVSVSSAHRDFGDITPGDDLEKYGTFVTLNLTPPVTTTSTHGDASRNGLSWCVGHGRVALAFSPDGTKLAGTFELTNGLAVVLWAVPR